VTQIAPALCDRLGDGDGLADLVCDRLGDGDGLGERDLDGLGLLEADGVGLLVWLGLDEPLGLCDALRLGLPVGLAPGDGLLDAVAVAVRGVDATVIASSLADTAATELCPHGEPIGRADEAKAGAIAKPDARNDPATRLTAIRPARSVATGTVALLSSSLP
jgi:hypothetical protein